MARHQPLHPESLSADSQRLYDLLNSGTDTSALIVAVSYIDACLASLLGKKLLKSSVAGKLLDSRSGAIGSFASRADLAYALALIDKPMYQDLLVLAELRNEVAHHHFELTFTSTEIITHCKRLNYVAGLRDSGTGGPLIEQSWIDNPRDKFMLTVSRIVTRLLLAALSTTNVQQPT